MNTYAWLLLGQTLLAVLVLGLCGGWALWPFRRAERPYLWLAAPLAGLFTLGGAMAVLYFGSRVLPFRWCLWLGVALNAAGTVACLVRGRPALPPLGNRTAALAVALSVGYWATVACNRTSIDAREPVVAIQDGSDMYGYAIVGDWLRAHPASEPPRPGVVYEVLAHVNLHVECSRPTAFLLTSAAGAARGTQSLFSYDWLCGVVLASAVIGFAGLFAGGPVALAVLALGAAGSSWLAVSRTGYLGKAIAYPGGLLLAALFLAAATEFTRSRAAVLAALGAAVAFCVNPMFPTVVLLLVFGGFAGATAVGFAAARLRDPNVRTRADLLRPVLVAALLYAGAALPTFTAHRLIYGGGVPATPSDWSVAIPVSLDLDLPALSLVKPETRGRLVTGCAVLLAPLLLVALRHRERTAAALLAVGLVVPGAWLLGVHKLHLFHGLLYPLTLAGAGALAGSLFGAGRRWQAAAVVLATVGFVGLRVPQSRATADRYVGAGNPQRVTIRKSESDAIRAAVGADAVDVWMAQWPDNCFVVTELAPHGTEVRLRSPAWERSLMNWAAAVGCPPPDLLAPKARFTLLEREAYAPPETVRYVGHRFKLCEDAGAVTVAGVVRPEIMVYDAKWRPMCWVGNAPTTILIHNGTGAPVAAHFVAEGGAGPARADTIRTLVYRLGEQTGRLELGRDAWQVRVPVRAEPGLNRLEVWVAEPAEPAPPTGHPVMLLHLLDPRVELAPPADPLARGPR